MYHVPPNRNNQGVNIVKKSPPDQPESNLPPRMGAPALRALASVGVTRLEQLTTFTEKDIKKLHGMGPKGIKQLHDALEQRGLAFATEK
jgi:hypothetical protein